MKRLFGVLILILAITMAGAAYGGSTGVTGGSKVLPESLGVFRNDPRHLRYTLEDRFITAIGAGAINGTAAEPGPGNRTVIDTTNKLTIAGRKLVCTGGTATFCNPLMSWPTQVRATGLAMSVVVNPVDGTKIADFGWSLAGSGQATAGIRTGATRDAALDGYYRVYKEWS